MKELLDQISDTEVLYKQAVSEFVSSIEPYLNADIVKELIHPDKVHIFKVPWVDRNGKTQINTGYRVQHSQLLGPYKGGIRFDKSVDLDTMKFLAFEQTLKNALTYLPLGGAKGGADFDPKNKTEAEILNFTESFMNQSFKLYGPNKDVPAGDLGVGKKEIAYMVKQYQTLTGNFEAAFTGKPLVLGGVVGREEATGYGLVYMIEHLLNDLDHTLENMRVIVSGCGNVALHAAEKAVEKGAIVVGISDSEGYLSNQEGLDIEMIKDQRLNEKKRLSEIDSDNFQQGSVFEVPCDIALPCATQSEMNEDQLRQLAQQGCTIIAEGANRPLTPKAVEALRDLDLYYIPGKAANAGGVAVSGLEMSQNAQKTVFTSEEVDKKLQDIMKVIYEEVSKSAADLDNPFNFLMGANYLSYQRVAEALKLQGLYQD